MKIILAALMLAAPLLTAAPSYADDSPISTSVLLSDKGVATSVDDASQARPTSHTLALASETTSGSVTISTADVDAHTSDCGGLTCAAYDLSARVMTLESYAATRYDRAKRYEPRRPQVVIDERASMVRRPEAIPMHRRRVLTRPGGDK